MPYEHRNEDLAYTKSGEDLDWLSAHKMFSFLERDECEVLRNIQNYAWTK